MVFVRSVISIGVNTASYILDNIDNDSNQQNNKKHVDYINLMKQNNKPTDKFFKF